MMNKNRFAILSLAMIFILACSFGSVPQAQPPIVEQPTYTPLPTYTPYPTTAVEQPTQTAEAVVPTQPAEPTTNPEVNPNAQPVKPDETFNGTTQSAAQLLYFNGQQDQRVTIILTGINHYQTFTIRTDKSQSLIGCKIDTQTICSITSYKLPYTGLYYILVDRTRDPRYEKNSYCKNAGANAASWCFISGPYSLILRFE